MLSGDAGRLGIGLLYPTQDCAEDDFALAPGVVDPEVIVEVAYTGPGSGKATDDFEGLKALGEHERLLVAARDLRKSFEPDALVWACTSGSFLWGSNGAKRQARRLTESQGVPASSTSLAFLRALEALDISRVAVGSVYSEEISLAFEEFLRSIDVETVHRVAIDAESDLELATWGSDRIFEIVNGCNAADAEAIVIPDTALHTIALVEELEADAKKPVLTSNQVTLWEAMRLAAGEAPSRGPGALFGAGTPAV